MKNFRLNNISLFVKGVARFQTHPTTYPSPFPKPMNPWDNLDPGRTDRSLNDEYDL